MMNTARGLKTGDLVRVPVGSDRREVVVESMSPDGRQFTTPRGACHDVAGAELVPHPVPIGPSRAWADLIALPIETLRSMAASGLLTAAEQWGVEDELGERDDPYPAAEEIASRLCRCTFGLTCAGHPARI